jgi:hypothetical protein
MNLLCSDGLVDDNAFNVEDSISQVDDLAAKVAGFTDCSTHLLTQFADVLQGSEVLWRLYCLARGLIVVGEFEYCQEEQDLELDADWSKADRHLIHGLLGQTRHGTCASMPVLYVAVGRLLGYPLHLVHSLGHVFARWDGMDHPLPAWRELRNAEFTSGFDSMTDEEYHEFPLKWPKELHEMERLRQPNPLYLRNLNASEEFASCLVQRAHAFEARNSFEIAMDAYRYACMLAPQNDMYVYFLRECSQKQVDSILPPFHLRAQEISKVVEKKLRGELTFFPREADCRIENRCSDRTSGPVLRAVQAELIERLSGKQINPSAMQFMTDTPKAADINDSRSHDSADAIFSDVSFSAND